MGYVSARKIYNILQNRILYILSKRKGKSGHMPVSLSVEPAAVCQLRCPECVLGRNELIRKKRYLDFELYKKVVDETAPYLTCLILYFQGEPFLAPDIFKMIEYADKKRVYTQTSTNAQAIDSACAEKIVKSGLRKLIVSMDGITQENYAKYRVGGSIEKTFKALEEINRFKKELHSKTPEIELQMLVFRHNEHEIADFLRMAKTLKANPVLKTAQIYDINDSDKSELIPQNSKYSRYKLRNGKWELKKPLKNKCMRMWQGAVLTSDGELLPCCFDKNGSFSYGNAETNSIRSLWNNEKAIRFRRQVSKDRKSIDICRNCSE